MGSPSEYGPSSRDVRAAMIELEEEHDVRLEVVVTPSRTPKLGLLYVYLAAYNVGEGSGDTPRSWRGFFFPCSEHRTLIGGMYAQLVGLDNDLTSLSRRKAEAQQLPMFPPAQ